MLFWIFLGSRNSTMKAMSVPPTKTSTRENDWITTNGKRTKEPNKLPSRTKRNTNKTVKCDICECFPWRRRGMGKYKFCNTTHNLLELNSLLLLLYILLHTYLFIIITIIIYDKYYKYIIIDYLYIYFFLYGLFYSKNCYMLIARFKSLFLNYSLFIFYVLFHSKNYYMSIARFKSLILNYSLFNFLYVLFNIKIYLQQMCL